MWIQVLLHSILHALFLFDAALFEGGWVVRCCSHRLSPGHRCSHAFLHFFLRWVVMMTMFIIFEERVSVEQDLVNDQNDRVSAENEQLR